MKFYINESFIEYNIFLTDISSVVMVKGLLHFLKYLFR